MARVTQVKKSLIESKGLEGFQSMMFRSAPLLTALRGENDVVIAVESG